MVRNLFNTKYKNLALKLGNMLSLHFWQMKLFIKTFYDPRELERVIGGVLVLGLPENDRKCTLPWGYFPKATGPCSRSPSAGTARCCCCVDFCCQLCLLPFQCAVCQPLLIRCFTKCMSKGRWEERYLTFVFLEEKIFHLSLCNWILFDWLSVTFLTNSSSKVYLAWIWLWPGVDTTLKGLLSTKDVHRMTQALSPV